VFNASAVQKKLQSTRVAWCVFKTKILSPALKNAATCYNAGIVVVDSEVVGLAPDVAVCFVRET
jgi:hypothetical protein